MSIELRKKSNDAAAVAAAREGVPPDCFFFFALSCPSKQTFARVFQIQFNLENILKCALKVNASVDTT